MSGPKIAVAVLNAFGVTAQGGNPAGVVLDAGRFDAAARQRIAAQAALSETAFVEASAGADFRVRFFTPTDEVDLCGHATIAAFAHMFRLGRMKAGWYLQETKAGTLGVEVDADGTVLMEQNLPDFENLVPREEVAESLGVGTDSLMSDLPVQIVSTGLRDVMVPVVSLRALMDLRPDMDRITDVSRRHGTVGYHAFTLETMRGSTAHCRNFGPLVGIPEESATGTSSGALACYLFKEGRVPPEKAGSMVFEQGYGMGKPSEIRVRLDIRDGAIVRVRVGGMAAPAGEKLVTLEAK